MRSFGYGFGLGRAPLVGGGDPLAGLPMAFRFESHDGRTLMPGSDAYRDCIVVSGAGSNDANGRYYFEYEGQWIRKDANYRLFWVSTHWIIEKVTGSGNWQYMTTESGFDISTPPSGISSWNVINDGQLPAPSTALIQEPQYKPLGLYQDASFLTPAVIDQQVGGWEYPGKPIRLYETNVMGQPTLRVKHGIPLVEFSNDAFISHGHSVEPHTGITVAVSFRTLETWHQAIVVGSVVDRAVRIGMAQPSASINADAVLPGGGGGNIQSTYQPELDKIVIASVVIEAGDVCLYVNGERAVHTPSAGGHTFAGAVSMGGDWGELIGGVDALGGSILAAYGYNAADRLAVEARCETLKGGVL